jgi:zinc D-Ala-D-Ala carboxypeptidase
VTWENFKREDFACKCGCGTNLMKDYVIDHAQTLRSRVKFPLVITSGYRCPAHNAKVSSTGENGPHTTGEAFDVGVDRLNAYIVLEEAMAMDVFTGIGVNQKGTGRFIHLDTLKVGRPAIWSY